MVERDAHFDHGRITVGFASVNPGCCKNCNGFRGASTQFLSANYQLAN